MRRPPIFCRVHKSSNSLYAFMACTGTTLHTYIDPSVAVQKLDTGAILWIWNLLVGLLRSAVQRIPSVMKYVRTQVVLETMIICPCFDDVSAVLIYSLQWQEADCDVMCSGAGKKWLFSIWRLVTWIRLEVLRKPAENTCRDRRCSGWELNTKFKC